MKQSVIRQIFNQHRVAGGLNPAAALEEAKIQLQKFYY